MRKYTLNNIHSNLEEMPMGKFIVKAVVGCDRTINQKIMMTLHNNLLTKSVFSVVYNCKAFRWVIMQQWTLITHYESFIFAVKLQPVIMKIYVFSLSQRISLESNAKRIWNFYKSMQFLNINSWKL